MASTGLILDGVFASQAIDSSGEVLDIAGCDISSLAKDGVLNYEHIDGSSKEAKAFGQEVVGRIIFAKKIFSAADCDNEREEEYWDQVRVPFIYGMVRLYDGAGHAGAQALAAMIRDHHANGESILVRFSIEGSTLQRDPHDKNHLLTSVARRVAATLKPCNRTCASGLVEDPQAPAGFDKSPVDSRDVADPAVEKGEDLPHPAYTKLGGSRELLVTPMESRHLSCRTALDTDYPVKKALSAGVASGAPSTLSGDAALQREDRGLRARAMSALREYGRRGRFDKTEFRAFAKQLLPEADDSFLDHFADLAQDYHLKKAEQVLKAMDLEGDRTVQPQEGLGWAEPPAVKPPKKLKASPKKSAKLKAKAKASPAGALTAPPSSQRPVDSGPPNPAAHIDGFGGGKNRLALRPDGTLVTPAGQKLQLHVPSGPEYMSVMHPDMYDISETDRNLYKRTVHEPWERAMKTWMELNGRARDGTTPRSVVKLAGLFSAMSPNTSVPLQERHYGHIMDMIHEGVMDVSKPVTEPQIQEFARRAQGPDYPNWNHDFYVEHAPVPGVSDWGEAAARAAETNQFGNSKADLPQINGLRHLDDLMPHLEHLFATHRDDGRAMAEKLMDMKSVYKRAAAKSGADEAREQLADKHPTVAGFGPKLARYALAMSGAGNIIVPDRHMIRSMYGLTRGDPLADYLATSVVTQARNEPMLRALDQHFFHKHPAVRHVLEKYPEHFKGREQQAIFPAFWLHWLHIPHYDRNRGVVAEPSEGSENGEYMMTGTDHQVFWDSIQDAMRRHGIPIRGRSYEYTPPDTSFDFGVNALGKAEEPHPWAHLPLEARALGVLLEMHMKHGPLGALAAYHFHLAPAMLDIERRQARRDPQAVVRKMEALAIDLRKATADLRAERAPHRARPAPVNFAGNRVLPGAAETASGRLALLYEDGEQYVGVPEDRVSGWGADDLVRLPKELEDTHYRVLSRPGVPVSELE